jgi:hypothetical protein
MNTNKRMETGQHIDVLPLTLPAVGGERAAVSTISLGILLLLVSLLLVLGLIR